MIYKNFQLKKKRKQITIKGIRTKVDIKDKLNQIIRDNFFKKNHNRIQNKIQNNKKKLMIKFNIIKKQ